MARDEAPQLVLILRLTSSLAHDSGGAPRHSGKCTMWSNQFNRIYRLESVSSGGFLSGRSSDLALPPRVRLRALRQSRAIAPVEIGRHRFKRGSERIPGTSPRLGGMRDSLLTAAEIICPAVLAATPADAFGMFRVQQAVFQLDQTFPVFTVLEAELPGSGVLSHDRPKSIQQRLPLARKIAYRYLFEPDEMAGVMTLQSYLALCRSLNLADGLAPSLPGGKASRRRIDSVTVFRRPPR